MRRFSIARILIVVLCIGAGCTHHRTIDLGTERINTRTPAHDLRTLENLVLHVRDGQRDYYVLVGPDQSKGGKYAQARVRNSVTRVEVVDGFMYLAGHYPIGATKNVVAAASGTTIVFELGTDYERVYLLARDKDTKKVQVSIGPGKSPVSGGKWAQVLQPGQYVHVTCSGDQVKLNDPVATPGPPGPIYEFLKGVKKAVDDANLPGWPTPWP